MLDKHFLPKTPSAGKGPPPLSFILPSRMTIETAEALAAELKQLPITEKTILTLDASHVENITTPGLQLMVSLEKTLQAREGTLVILGLREPCLRAFRDTGLESLLSKAS